MRSRTLVAAAGTAALFLTGCGAKPGGRGVIDDQRNAHIGCIREAGLQVTKVGQTQLQIGQAPAGPTVDYRPSPGDAQGVQLHGEHPGSEVIGTVLLTPNQASDPELGKIETCLAEGVKG